MKKIVKARSYIILLKKSNSNVLNSNTDKISIGSTQDTEVNRDTEDAAEIINDDESVASINK